MCGPQNLGNRSGCPPVEQQAADARLRMMGTAGPKPEQQAAQACLTTMRLASSTVGVHCSIQPTASTHSGRLPTWGWCIVVRSELSQRA
jgi:hypothetical protein